MRSLPKYLTQDELQRFSAAIPSPRDRVLFAVIYYYGLRVDEAASSCSRTWIWRTTGSGSGGPRTTSGGEKPLWRHNAKLFRRRDPGPYLFTGRQGAIKKRMIQNLFIRSAQAAGIEGRSIHSPRHSIAVHFLNVGRGIEYMADRLGHTSIQNTESTRRSPTPSASRLSAIPSGIRKS